MMPLHQGLELGLDLGRRGFVLDAKRVACLALGIVHNPRFAPAGLFALGAGAKMTEQAERVGGVPGVKRAECERSVGLPPFMPIFQVGR